MHEGYSKVFVALDGTEQQDFVLARAIKVAANNGAALIIGHVIDSTALESAGSYPADLVQGLQDAFTNSIAAQVEQAKANPAIPSVDVVIRAGRLHLDVPAAQHRLRHPGRQVAPSGTRRAPTYPQLRRPPLSDGLLHVPIGDRHKMRLSSSARLATCQNREKSHFVPVPNWDVRDGRRWRFGPSVAGAPAPRTGPECRPWPRLGRATARAHDRPAPRRPAR